MGYTRVAVRKINDHMLSVWYYDHEQLIAVDAMNDAKAFMTVRRWLSSGQSPAFADIADDSKDLQALTLYGKTDLVT